MRIFSLKCVLPSFYQNILGILIKHVRKPCRSYNFIALLFTSAYTVKGAKTRSLCILLLFAKSMKEMMQNVKK